MRAMLSALLILITMCSSVLANSTINPTVPGSGSALSSQVVRNNFLAAYNDVNNILGGYAGTSPPGNPVDMQTWVDRTTTPVYVFKYWNAQNSVWVPYASLNINSNAYTPIFSSVGFVATPPLLVSVSGGGVVTYSLSRDANFVVNGSSQLALASAASGSLLANCTASTSEPVSCSWTAFADRVVGSSNGMLPYRTGGSWGSLSTGTSGAVLPLLSGANIWSTTQTVYPGSSGLQAALPGTLLRAISLDGVITRAELDGFGAPSAFTGARANNTAASPTTLVLGDEITTLSAWGYNGSAMSGPAGVVRIYSGGTWSGTNQPTYLDIATTANGDATRTLTSRMRVENDGGVTVPSTVTGGSKGAGTINATGLYVGGVAISASATNLTVGTSVISGGSTTRVLFDNSGVLGEYSITGTGSVVMSSSPSISSPTVTTPSISGGSHTALTSFSLKSSASAFNMIVQNAEVLTSDVGLTITLNNVGRGVNLNGNLTVVGNLQTPAVAQGDVWYGSATGVMSALAKDTNATRYISNSGSSNIPAWAQVSLTNGVTGSLLAANYPLATGDSYLGRITAGSGAMAALQINGGVNCTNALTYVNGTGFGCNVTAGTGTVTQVICSAGLTGGTITASGTCGLDPGYVQNFLTGFGLANNVSDATNDIDISPGVAADSTNAVLIKLTSALTKRTDAAWAVGTNQGCWDTGSVANGTIHWWVIRRSDTGVVEVLCSASATAPTMPASYDSKRRIGSLIRLSAALLAFTQFGNDFWLNVPFSEASISTLTTASQTVTLTAAPTGVAIIGRLKFYTFTTGVGTTVWVRPLFVTDAAVTVQTNANMRDSSAGAGALVELQVQLNTSAQFAIRAAAAVTEFDTVVRGWTDTRGQ